MGDVRIVKCDACSVDLTAKKSPGVGLRAPRRVSIQVAWSGVELAGGALGPETDHVKWFCPTCAPRFALSVSGLLFGTDGLAPVDVHASRRAQLAAQRRASALREVERAVAALAATLKE